MNIKETALPGVLVIEPRVFRDDRGLFVEVFSAQRYGALGLPDIFAQDNMSRSACGTVRGLHFQEPNGQGKLVQVTRGSVFDVVVDVRRGSPTFGKWIGVELDGDSARQMWIPPGFAHGFCATSDVADFLYKCTTPYSPESERCIRWNDPDIGIQWPVVDPRLSPKDAAAPTLREAPVLPTY